VNSAGPVLKADLPLARARKVQQALVKDHVLKRPASIAKRPAAAICAHRTPFTLKREGRLITGGVKRSIFKRQ
jgi:hypothetical protein